jgi:hypothetical protein
MGSGKFAEAGFLGSAYIRNPTYYDPVWFAVRPDGSGTSKPYKATCYSQSRWNEVDVFDDNAFFFLGGPGGKDPGCEWPSP